MHSDDAMRGENEKDEEGRAPTSSAQELLWECVEKVNRGEAIDEVELRAAHLELADEVLRQLAAFQEIGDEGGADGSPPLGTLGDYNLRRQLGRGGMGVVYEAWEVSMDRAVALKVLPPGVAADNRTFQRFMQEAKTAGKLSHQNIVPVYSTGIKEGTPWFSMEYVAGETLAQVLAKIKDAEPDTGTPFGPKDQVGYFAALANAFADVADGLQHAHSQGVTHRDIKPSNLILDSGDRLRILDFGLARLEGQESLTLSGDFVGTPLYMSPEQARRKKLPVDHRTDVYSLGATMYEALCGRPPFQGRDHADTLSQIVDRDPVEPRRENPSVPQDLETIVLKCLRKGIGDRYGTAEALGQDLRRFVRGELVEARPISGWERFARRYRRHWKAGAMVVSASLIVLAAGLGILDYLRGIRDAAKLAHMHHERGILLFRDREYGDAAEEFSKAIRLSPNHLSFDARGESLEKLGHPERAVADYARSIRWNVGFSLKAHRRLLRACLMAGNPPGACQVVERLIAERTAAIEAGKGDVETRKSLGVLHQIRAELLLGEGRAGEAAVAAGWAWDHLTPGLRHPAVTLSLLRACLADSKWDGNRTGTPRQKWREECASRIQELEKLVEARLDSPYAVEGELVPLELEPLTNARLDESFHGTDFASKTLEELPRGLHEFVGVRFLIGDSLVQLRGWRLPVHPERVEGIEVNEQVSRIHALQAVGWSAEEGTVVGHFEVRYEDDTRAEVPLVYGVDTRDWWGEGKSPVISRGKLAWLGTNPRSRLNLDPIRLYVSTWKNPEPGKAVTTIAFVSANTSAAPFCVALTVERPPVPAASARRDPARREVEVTREPLPDDP